MTQPIEIACADAIRAFQGPLIVTGAGGWLGRATLGLFAEWLGPERFAAQVTAYATAARTQDVRPGIKIDCRPLSDLRADLHPAGGLICHYAFLTKDKVASLGADAYRAENQEISDILLGAVRRLRALGVFLTSSGAADGRQADAGGQLYGALKVKDEDDFAAAALETGSRLIITRLYNIAGPYINKPEAYAMAAILLDLLAGRPVRLKAKAPVLRSYTHVGDAIGLSLLALLSPSIKQSVLRFDTEGDSLVEIGTLADRARTLLKRDDIAIERDWDPAASGNHYQGDGTAMRQLADALGVSLHGLDRQILDTAAYLSSMAVQG